MMHLEVLTWITRVSWCYVQNYMNIQRWWMVSVIGQSLAAQSVEESIP